MPGRNIYKEYIPNSYYHIYNRGVGGMTVFKDEVDYTVFLSLLKRYLDIQPSFNPEGEAYPSLHGELELLAYCLMPNHFHLFIYQHTQYAMKQLMTSLGTSYGMYFNKHYSRYGPLFQQRYRAKHINNDAYLLHISRYIHLNPKKYENWQWSSLPYYTGQYRAEWVQPRRILDLFTGTDYQKFIIDHVDNNSELDDLSDYLAD